MIGRKIALLVLVQRCVPLLGALAALACMLNGLNTSWPHEGYLFDFAGFIASGRAAVEGLNPYAVYPDVPVWRWNGLVAAGVNLNPPLSVLAFAAVAQLDPGSAFRIWFGVSFLLYGAIAAGLARAYPQRHWKGRVLWALSIWPFWNTLILGQIYVFVAALVVVVWILLRHRRAVLAGVFLGVLVAVKPNFALWPLLLLVSGQRRVPLTAFATAGVLSLIPVLVYSPGVYTEWLAVIGSNTLITYPDNGSIIAAALRLGVPKRGVAVALTLVAGLGVFVWHRRPTTLDVSCLGLLASLLASPIAWAGYVLVLLPIFFSRRWNLPLVGAAALWMVPEYWVVSNYADAGWRFWVFGFAYLLALLLVLGGVLRELLRDEYARQSMLAQWHSYAPTRVRPNGAARQGVTTTSTQ